MLGDTGYVSDLEPNQLGRVSTRDARYNRRLLRGVQHVQELWFPFNPTVLNQLQPSSIDRLLESGPDALYHVLKSDCSLLTYVVTALQRERQSPCHFRTNRDLMDLFSAVSARRIGEIVEQGRRISSVHQFRTAHPFQLRRISETLIIASTVAALSAANDLDPGLGFFKAVQRESGLNLIAWNYPTLYKSVLDTVSPIRSVSDVLLESLGFSPDDLVQALTLPVKNVRFPFEDVEFGVEDDPYTGLHEVGRALARSAFPDVHPTAKRDWYDSSLRLKRIIGPNFIRIVRARIAEVAKPYCDLIPNAFAFLKDFNPEHHHGAPHASQRVFSNPYVRECPEVVQESLEVFYAEMPEDRPNRENLKFLIKNIIPQAGFTGGCLFLVNDSSGVLTPRTVFGRVKARQLTPVPLLSGELRYQGLSRVVIDGSTDAVERVPDPVARAFIGKGVVITGRSVNTILDDAPDGMKLHQYSASIGEVGPIGVLYLERPTDVDGPIDRSGLNMFRAINRSLSDALMID